MEVDTVDVDLDLINKLNTMGTRDKEDLLTQFQSIVGNQISPGGCSFYLEMGNWNLQTALCAYYDVTSSPEHLPSFLVVDETNHINENGVTPNQSFVKAWRIKNIGHETWPHNMKLKFYKGFNFGNVDVVTIPAIGPNETTDVSVPMTAPAQNGNYEGQWRVVTLAGMYCGGVLLVSVNVDSSNISSLTQQMSTLGQSETIHNGEHSQPISTPFRAPVAATPFCSPTGYGIFGAPSIPSSSLNGEHLSTIDESNLQERTNNLEQSEHFNEFS